SRRNPRLMEPAALALGELGAAARAPLLALLQEAHPGDPALFAAEVALECQGEEAVPDVLRLLEGGRPHLVEVAVWVLSQGQDARAAEPLLARLGEMADRYPVLDYVRRG